MHDSLNAVRTACKDVSGGAVWRAVARMASIQNVPYGRFGTVAWGRWLQETHVSAVEELHQDSPEIVAAMENQGVLTPLRFGGF